MLLLIKNKTTFDVPGGFAKFGNLAIIAFTALAPWFCAPGFCRVCLFNLFDCSLHWAFNSSLSADVRIMRLVIII